MAMMPPIKRVPLKQAFDDKKKRQTAEFIVKRIQNKVLISKVANTASHTIKVDACQGSEAGFAEPATLHLDVRGQHTLRWKDPIYVRLKSGMAHGFPQQLQGIVCALVSVMAGASGCLMGRPSAVRVVPRCQPARVGRRRSQLGKGLAHGHSATWLALNQFCADRFAVCLAIRQGCDYASERVQSLHLSAPGAQLRRAS